MGGIQIFMEVSSNMEMAPNMQFFRLGMLIQMVLAQLASQGQQHLKIKFPSGQREVELLLDHLETKARV
jgi:hypothetical protein